MSKTPSQPQQTKSNLTFDDNNNTKLHFASASGKVDDVVEEIANGYKTDPMNYLDWTPLMMAARNGHFETVKMLIEHNADASKRNKFGASVFLMAVSNGNLDLIHFILQHLLCGGVSKQSMEVVFSPISFAVLFNHEHVVNYLLEKSFHLDSKISRIGLTPLMFAAVKDNTTLMQLLSSKGVGIDTKNVNNQSAEEILRDVQKNKPRLPYQYVQQIPSPSQCAPPPFICITPQPHEQCVQMDHHMAQHHHLLRKSSDLISPSYIFPLNVTPISPIGMIPQIFFPPDFIPPAYLGQVNNNFHNDALNSRISFLSPTASLYPVYSPYCPNSFYY